MSKTSLGLVIVVLFDSPEDTVPLSLLIGVEGVVGTAATDV